MNTRRLTKKYKHKSRSKKTRRNRKSRKSRRSRRRGLKGGGHSVRPSARPTGVVVKSSRSSRTSGASSSASIRPSSSAGISKHGDNFNFHDFYNKLMNTPVGQLHSTLQDNKYMYIKNTTFQTFDPKGAYLNMTGLKFVNYLYGRFNREHGKRKYHLSSIIYQLDQTGMAQGVRYSDLDIIRENVTLEYFNLYKELYDEIDGKLFPNRNPRNYPLSTSAIPLYCKPLLKAVREDDDKQPEP